MKNRKELEEIRWKYFDENMNPDYVLETREGKDFTEYVYSIGGDVCTNRVYGSSVADFSITAR